MTVGVASSSSSGTVYGCLMMFGEELVNVVSLEAYVYTRVVGAVIALGGAWQNFVLVLHASLRADVSDKHEASHQCYHVLYRHHIAELL